MFCGDLLNVSPGCYLHPFESRSPQGRKPARHAAAVLGEREIFFGLMKLAKWPEKIYCERHRRPWTARRVVLVSAPAKGLKRVKKPGNEASRNPPQRRRARARNGVAPYSPARFGGIAGMQGAQVTARQSGASVYGCCKLALASGWKPAARRAGQRQRSWLCAKHDSRLDAQEQPTRIEISI